MVRPSPLRRAKRDAAVSPIVGGLVLAVTALLLAAGIYQWVATFGSEQSQPTRAISLTSNPGLVDGVKTYLIAQALPPGLQWKGLYVRHNGVDLAHATTSCSESPPVGAFLACSGSALGPDAHIVAGQTLRLRAEQGDRLHIVDGRTNVILYSLTVR